MLSIRLPEDLATRLNFLAAQTNRTKSFYAIEAIRRYLEDLEDLYFGEKAYKEFILSGEKALSTKEVQKELEL
ncbi:MAG: ribbon-helix-helix protein, CopG family [Desulfamplus sp.]|nr:ribbon-helix-helix protein, CopG family [Desulfamplus sp.]MBF0468411.1 ribbon-helix-helix protein, CopG family [Desulfamplus sp.]